MWPESVPRRHESPHPSGSRVWRRAFPTRSPRLMPAGSLCGSARPRPAARGTLRVVARLARSGGAFRGRRLRASRASRSLRGGPGSTAAATTCPRPGLRRLTGSRLQLPLRSRLRSRRKADVHHGHDRLGSEAGSGSEGGSGAADGWALRPDRAPQAPPPPSEGSAATLAGSTRPAQALGPARAEPSTLVALQLHTESPAWGGRRCDGLGP